MFRNVRAFILVVERGENQSTQRKTSRSREEDQQTQPTYDTRSGDTGHIGGRRAISPLHHPCSPKMANGNGTKLFSTLRGTNSKTPINILSYFFQLSQGNTFEHPNRYQNCILTPKRYTCPFYTRVPPWARNPIHPRTFSTIIYTCLLLLLLLWLHECWLTGSPHSHRHSLGRNSLHPVEHSGMLVGASLLRLLLWSNVHPTWDTIHLRLTAMSFWCIQCHYAVCRQNEQKYLEYECKQNRTFLKGSNSPKV